MKGRILEPEDKAVAKQWLDKHISIEMDMLSNNRGTVGSSAIYVARIKAI
jgi:hypothetical protein